MSLTADDLELYGPPTTPLEDIPPKPTTLRRHRNAIIFIVVFLLFVLVFVLLGVFVNGYILIALVPLGAILFLWARIYF